MYCNTSHSTLLCWAHLGQSQKHNDIAGVDQIGPTNRLLTRGTNQGYRERPWGPLARWSRRGRFARRSHGPARRTSDRVRNRAAGRVRTTLAGHTAYAQHNIAVCAHGSGNLYFLVSPCASWIARNRAAGGVRTALSVHTAAAYGCVVLDCLVQRKLEGAQPRRRKSTHLMARTSDLSRSLYAFTYATPPGSTPL